MKTKDEYSCEKLFRQKTTNRKIYATAFLGAFLLVGPLLELSKVSAEVAPIENQKQVKSVNEVTSANSQSLLLETPKKERVLDPVYFSQNDDKWREYKYSMYGEPRWRTVYEGGPQNIGRSGCAVTNVAMAFESLLRQGITPIEIADYSVANGYRTYNKGTSAALIPNSARDYGINCYTTSNLIEVIDTMKNNKNCVVLVSTAAGSHFTCHGHYLTLTDVELRDDGYNWFTVYDSNTYSRPYGPNGKLYVDNPNYTAWKPTREIELTDQTGIVKSRSRLVNRNRNSTYYILWVDSK